MESHTTYILRGLADIHAPAPALVVASMQSDGRGKVFFPSWRASRRHPLSSAGRPSGCRAPICVSLVGGGRRQVSPRPLFIFRNARLPRVSAGQAPLRVRGRIDCAAPAHAAPFWAGKIEIADMLSVLLCGTMC